jgi:hypothetical protein
MYDVLLIRQPLDQSRCAAALELSILVAVAISSSRRIEGRRLKASPVSRAAARAPRLGIAASTA